MNAAGDHHLQSVLRALREAGESGTTRTELAERLEISLRTLDRHLQHLKDDGAIIECLRENRTTSMRMVLREPPAWEMIANKDEELALELALDLLHGVGAQNWAEQLSGLTRFCYQESAARKKRAFERFKSRIILRAPSIGALAPKSEVLRAILESLKTEGGVRELEFKYLSARRRLEQRTVIPYALCYDATYRGAYLLAWDSQFQRPNFFRVSRIQEARAGGFTSLAPKAEETLTKALDYNIGGRFEDVPPFTVKVRIYGERWFQGFFDAPPTLPEFDIRESKKTKASDERTAIVSFQATEFEGPCRWILQFGSNAEVLDPDPLREWVRARLEMAIARYHSPNGRA